MGRSKKISPEELSEKFKQYKNECDNHVAITHAFSQKLCAFISEKLKKPITYTIEGFCVFAKLTRSSFYANYETDEAYKDIVTRIREECESNTRSKFEDGSIPTQLAGLWMSKYGYAAKNDSKVTGSIGVKFVDDLQADGEGNDNG